MIKLPEAYKNTANNTEEKEQGANLGNQNRFGFLEAATELFIFRSKLLAVSAPIITKITNTHKIQSCILL